MTSFNYKMNDYYQRNMRLITDLSEDEQSTIWTILSNQTGYSIEDLKSNANNLRIFDDEQDTMILVHFVDPMVSKASARIHGIIIDMVTKKVVADALPYTPEVVGENIHTDNEGQLCYDDEELFCNIVFNQPHHYVYAMEGTVMRLFHNGNGGSHNGWYISTHKKINGGHSRWGSSPKFSVIMEEFIPNFWDIVETKFDKNNCYIFMVSHPNNRLVDCPSTPCVTLINAFTRTEDGLMKLAPAMTDETYFNIPTNYNLVITPDTDCCVHMAMDKPVLVYSDDLKICVKLVTPKYMSLRQLRGNEPNLQLRYMQIKYDMKDTEKLGAFITLFSDFLSQFNELTNVEDTIVKYLEQCYIIRYAQGKFLKLPPEEHHVLHSLHLSSDSDVLAGRLKDALYKKIKTSNGRQLYAMFKHSKEFKK